MIVRFILFSCILFLSQSCSWEKEKPKPQDKNVCDTTQLTYAQAIAPILTTNCLNHNCHTTASTGANPGNPVGTNWQDSTQLRTYLQKPNNQFLKRIKQDDNGVSAPYMPLGYPKLSDCEIYKIELWIQKGMP